jgi:hypothetical protein
MFSTASCYYIVSHLSKLLHQKLRPLRRSKSFGGRGTTASIYETGKRMLIISVIVIIVVLYCFNFIDTEEQITLTSIGSGLIAITG